LDDKDLDGERKIRVFIVDDRPRSLDGLRALLATRPEFEIIGEASNGKEALQKIEIIQPEVVVMDANMPVMSGIEACRYIKERWPQIKVIILTMYSSYEADAKITGADVFMVKGCCSENLFEAMKS
jgi:DNA-binding NarL/FixJ family response regulator